MGGGWQPIATAPKNDERILVSGGTWIRGNKQQLAQSFPCLVIWDETERLICDKRDRGRLLEVRDCGWQSLPFRLKRNHHDCGPVIPARRTAATGAIRTEIAL
jgi:hypothetical protein